MEEQRKKPERLDKAVMEVAMSQQTYQPQSAGLGKDVQGKIDRHTLTETQAQEALIKMEKQDQAKQYQSQTDLQARINNMFKYKPK